MKKAKYLLSIPFHPIGGYEELRHYKDYSTPVSLIVLLAWFGTSILQKRYTGFVFNPTRDDKINILVILAATIGLFTLAVIANWAITTLFDGEGSFKAIWVSVSYSLIPYIVITLFATFISNFFTYEEAIFLTWLSTIGMVWTIILLIGALKVAHQYSLSKTILSIFFSIAGVLIILFLMSLVFRLFFQIVVFVRTVYSELVYRL